MSVKHLAAVALLLASFVSGCTEREKCDRANAKVQGTMDICSAAQVDTSVDAATAVHDRIMSALKTDDGIAVYVVDGTNPTTRPNVISIVASVKQHTIMVIANDHWLPQESADRIMGETAGEPDQISRVVLIINKIHEWQATHPRPPASVSQPQSAASSVVQSSTAPQTVTQTQTQTVTVTAKPEPPPGPPPPYDWSPMIIIGSIVLGLILYATMAMVVLRGVTVYYRRKCTYCDEKTGRIKLCSHRDHDGIQWVIGIFWPIALLVVSSYKWAMKMGDRVMNIDHTPRQERKLLAEKNKAEQIRLEKLKAHTAYLDSLAVLKSAGYDPPKFDEED